VTVTVRNESGNHEILPSVPIVAPVTGIVISFSVDIGQVVDIGQSIIVIESMKMELQITAPYDGALAALHVAPGDQVALDAVLASMARVAVAEVAT